MEMTITNNDAINPLVVDFRGLLDRTTIAAGGGASIFGVSLFDLQYGEDTGNPAWKYLDNLVKQGDIVITFAADADQQSVVDAANEV